MHACMQKSYTNNAIQTIIALLKAMHACTHTPWNGLFNPVACSAL